MSGVTPTGKMASPKATGSSNSTSTIPNDTNLDADIDPEIDLSIDPAAPDPENAEMEDAALPEPREATKKDISLRDFMGKMDDYAPIVRRTSAPQSLTLRATFATDTAY